MATSSETSGHFCMKRSICDYNSMEDKAVLLNGDATEKPESAKSKADKTVNSRAEANGVGSNAMKNDNNGISVKLATLCKCVYCSCTDQLPHAVKVLPCLHAICRGCLQECVQSDDLPGSQCIFSCPMCNYKVQIPKNGISGLKNIPLSLFPSDISENLDLGEDSLSGSSSGQIPLSVSAYPGLNMCCPSVIGDNDKVDIANVLHCNSCDILVCKTCIQETHSEHSKTQLVEMLKSKTDYINKLLDQVHLKIDRHKQKQNLLETCKDNIAKLKEELKSDVEDRAKYLIQMIQKRKETVLMEINQVHEQYIEKYEQSTAKLAKEVLTMQSSYDFASQVSETKYDEDILNFHSDITNRLLQLVHQIKEATVEILNLKLDIPEKGREESHMEKMFGSLLQGNVSCGNADMLTSFLIDLQWPSSLAATAFNTFVVAGKTGAFESEGKLFYYDRHGNLLQRHEFEDGRIPNDVIYAPNGCLWVTDNLGQISKFSSRGVLLETWQNKFKGGGHLALTTQHELLVSSIEDKCVIKYDERGNFLQRIPSSDVYSLIPHCIASNQNNDIIIADHHAGAVFVFDCKGDIQFKFGGNDDNGAILKCPSDVCCDPFNNILVADFTNDRVVIISKAGEFLGYLLTKENGISCPNFISLDHEGHLFVGQYGGEIHVFRYLSFIKNA